MDRKSGFANIVDVTFAEALAETAF